MQLDIVFTAPHPDDLEIGCGGTIARLVKLGYRVGIVHMTNGEPTPRGSVETRLREAREAADVLGATICEILDLTNRELMDSPQARYAVATVLRKYRPRILVGLAGRTPGASPDHYQAQLLTEAARFYSQLTRWDDRFGGTAPHRIDHLVYRPIPGAAEFSIFPTRFVCDITETIDQKLAAIQCYRSQFAGDRWEWLRHYVLSTAGFEGALAGVRYGEMYAMPRMLKAPDLVALVGTLDTPSPLQDPGGPASATDLR